MGLHPSVGAKTSSIVLTASASMPTSRGREIAVNRAMTRSDDMPRAKASSGGSFRLHGLVCEVDGRTSERSQRLSCDKTRLGRMSIVALTPHRQGPNLWRGESGGGRFSAACQRMGHSLGNSGETPAPLYQLEQGRRSANRNFAPLVPEEVSAARQRTPYLEVVSITRRPAVPASSPR